MSYLPESVYDVRQVRPSLRESADGFHELPGCRPNRNVLFSKRDAGRIR